MAKLLRRPAVEKIIGNKRTFIYSRLDPKNSNYDPTFPKPLKIDSMTNVWVEDEVYAWVDSIISKARDEQAT